MRTDRGALSRCAMRARYVWGNRPGHYFGEWWEGKQRRRESAGIAPSEALEAQ
ncbi:MAG: hypothetical protein ABSG10_08350 [Terracidiphilus sp.]